MSVVLEGEKEVVARRVDQWRRQDSRSGGSRNGYTPSASARRRRALLGRWRWGGGATRGDGRTGGRGGVEAGSGLSICSPRTRAAEEDGVVDAADWHVKGCNNAWPLLLVFPSGVTWDGGCGEEWGGVGAREGQSSPSLPSASTGVFSMSDVVFINTFKESSTLSTAGLTSPRLHSTRPSVQLHRTVRYRLVSWNSQCPSPSVQP